MSKIICQRIVGLTAPLATSLLALPSVAQTTPQIASQITPETIDTTQTVAPSTAVPTTINGPLEVGVVAPEALPTVAPTMPEPTPALSRLLQGVKPIADPNLLERLTAAPTATPVETLPVTPIAPEPLTPEALPTFSQWQQDSKLAVKPDLTEQWAFPVTVEAAEQQVHLVLRLEERQLYVYRGDTVETTFPVAVGKPGWETPTGRFEVSHMLENPGWTNPFTDEVVSPGPENPLGERWIAFWTDGEYQIGFHGTPNRESVGQAASHGCVRLYNEHVRELYDLVDPGTLVTVLP
ncbi:MAG: L,D-transpeptidase family protein [Cyanobacteria bacterium P01_D01_bin.2]